MLTPEVVSAPGPDLAMPGNPEVVYDDRRALVRASIDLPERGDVHVYAHLNSDHVMVRIRDTRLRLDRATAAELAADIIKAMAWVQETSAPDLDEYFGTVKAIEP